MVNSYDLAILSEKVAYLEGALKSAGIELPAVTSDDNGKTLQVVDGAWATGNLIPAVPAVINALNSTSETDALAAAQGKALNDLLSLNSGNEAYFTTYPNGKKYGGNNTQVSMSFFKKGGTLSISELYVYDADGNFTDIKTGAIIQSQSNCQVSIEFPFNASHAGKLLKITINETL